MNRLALSKLRSIWLILTSHRFVAASLDDSGRMKVIRNQSSPEAVKPLVLAKDRNRI